MRLPLLLSAPLLLLLVACEPAPAGICADPSHRNAAGLPPIDASPINAEEREINRRIPSYAGAYPSGRAVIVLLTEGASDAELEAAQQLGLEKGQRWSQQIAGLETAEVRTAARFTFAELDAFWLQSLDFAFASGVQSLRIKPEFNRVEAFVPDEETADRVLSQWEAGGLPADALHFEIGQDVYFLLLGCPG